MLNLPGFVSVLCLVFPSRDGFTGKWCGGWESNARRPTPQDFSCEPHLKSSPVRSCERSCPFDLNPAMTGRGPLHGLGYPRIGPPLFLWALKTKNLRTAFGGLPEGRLLRKIS